jgi:hypothetical protein
MKEKMWMVKRKDMGEEEEEVSGGGGDIGEENDGSNGESFGVPLTPSSPSSSSSSSSPPPPSLSNLVWETVLTDNHANANPLVVDVIGQSNDPTPM